MANTIRLKRASGSDPGASDLVVGEVAVRTDTGKLFTKKDDNSIAEISGGIDDGDKGDITVSSSGATFTIDSGVVTSAKIADDTIVNADINSSAAIAFSKLATGTLPSGITVNSGNIVNGSILDSDINASATIAGTKITPNFGSQDITASDLILTGTGTSSSNSLDLTYNASSGVASINADSNGGNTALQFGTSSSGTLNTNRLGIATDGTVSVAGNLDVGAGVDVTGDVGASGVIRGDSSNSGKWVRMYGSSGTGRWDIYGHGANLRISDNDSAGSFVCDRNADFSAGVDVTGNITVSGTVDGRDVATDGTKLDGIAASATNVTNNNQLTNGAGYITATLTNEQVQDIVGGMVTGNTESGITVTYQDGDGTLDFVVGTLNQNTTGSSASCTGNAATATQLANARTIAGVSFNGTANISLNNNAITNGAGYITSADGGNAATLDGIDSASFARSDASDTMSGDYTFSSSSQDVINLSANSTNDNRGIAINSRTALSADYNDGYLRLNNNQEFANGVYTPLVMRADGGFNVDGTTVINNNATIPSARLTGALPAIDGSSLTGISAGATGGGSDEIFYENGQNVTTSYTITNGKNAMAAGPITIDSGAVVTVGAGETLTIV